MRAAARDSRDSVKLEIYSFFFVFRNLGFLKISNPSQGFESFQRFGVDCVCDQSSELIGFNTPTHTHTYINPSAKDGVAARGYSCGEHMGCS